jgi:hypothetical protein
LLRVASVRTVADAIAAGVKVDEMARLALATSAVGGTADGMIRCGSGLLLVGFAMRPAMKCWM